MSWRIDEQRMLASATRSWMENLSPSDVSVCDIHTGTQVEGAAPTVEIGFHAAILRTRPDVNVVLHFQAPCATVLACRAREGINYNVIPEIPFYIGPIAHVPYLPPGSGELADAVAVAMQDHDMVLMGNHGQTTVAVDFPHAVQNAEFFELACEIVLRGGNEATPIAPEAVSDLLALRQASRAAV